MMEDEELNEFHRLLLKCADGLIACLKELNRPLSFEQEEKKEE